MRLWREVRFESKCKKQTVLGPLSEVEMSNKCTPLRHEASFEVKTRCSDHFRTFKRRCSWQAQWILHLVKDEQNVRALRQFQKDGRRETLEEGLQRGISRGRCGTCGTRDINESDNVRRSESRFPERVGILEHQIFRLWPGLTFSCRRTTCERWDGKS